MGNLSPAARNPLPNPEFWRGRRVLLTGHTGFKGSWLTLWLRTLGADVLGVALPEPPTLPSLWDQLGLDDTHDVRADIVGDGWIPSAEQFAPEIVLHLAAQSLVATGYQQPARTFEVNVQGTVKVMDLVARLDGVLATLVITTDKVYDPRQEPPHGEAHFLGATDPYAASKAAAEIVVRSWPPAVWPRATARAGNVIGGGDWAANRLLPDLVRAWGAGVPLVLRNPEGIRPWQHVLEPLRGYLVFAEALAAGRELPPGLNFGPADVQSVAVAELVRFAATEWRRLAGDLPDPEWIPYDEPQFSEAHELTLDSRLVADQLGWSGVLDWRDAVTLTLEWYCAERAGARPADLIATQLEAYAATVRRSW